MNKTFFESEIRLCHFMMDYINELTTDITARDFNKQVIADSITPAWVLGHISYEMTRTADWLGCKIDLNEVWGEYFCQGSSAANIPEAFTKDLLINTFNELMDSFVDQLDSVSDERLHRSNPSTLLSDYLPEVRHDVAHMLTTHLGIHAGQIGMWRKTYGLKNKYGRQ